MDLIPLFSFGNLLVDSVKNSSLLQTLRDSHESFSHKNAADILLCMFLIIYLLCYFLRSDSAAAVILKYLGGVLTGCFLIMGLFLYNTTFFLKVTIIIVLVLFVIGYSLKIVLAIRCKSWLPLCADEDCYVCYNAGGINYCMPFDPNEPYLTLVVHNNGITCGSYKLYGAAALADRIALVTLTKTTHYSLQETFDTGLCVLAFYVAEIAIIENHTVVGNNLKLELKEEPVYEVPCATINVPL
nr:non-structural protein NS4 [Betacoronavirus sp.]WDR17880.1 ORF4 protein [Hipposideros armiger Coronavirus]